MMNKELNIKFIERLKERNDSLPYPYAHVLLDQDTESRTYGQYYAVVWFDEEGHLAFNYMKSKEAIDEWIKVTRAEGYKPRVIPPAEYWVS